MKRLLILLAVVFIAATSARSQVYYKERDDTVPKMSPHYLVVYRSWDSVNRLTGSDSVMFGQEWVTHSQVFETLEQVVAYLNDSTSGLSTGDYTLVYPRVTEGDLIGIWKIDAPNVKLTFEKIPHVKPKHVEEVKWIETRWKLNKE